MKLKKRSAVSIIFAVVLVAAAAIGALAVNAQSNDPSSNVDRAEWQRYVETQVDPYREKIRLAGSTDDWAFRGTSMSQLKGYQLSVGNPSDLEPVGSENGGFVQMVLWSDEYKIEIMRFLTDPAVYVVGLGDVTLSSTGGTIVNSYGSAADRDGNALPRSPLDSEEFYLIWLEKYEKYNEEIMEMFDAAKNIFGDLW